MARHAQMIRKKAEMEREVRERMRDGTGVVEILHVFRQKEGASMERSDSWRACAS